MPSGSDSDGTAPWIDARSRDDALPDAPRVEAIPDTESGTVTLAWRRPGDGETTAAWITADADHVVDGSDMQ
jgi:hypothetical protein